MHDKRTPQGLEPKTSHHIKFVNIGLLDLSRFLRFEISHEGGLGRSFLVKMQLDIPEGRNDSIFKSIIDSQEKFFAYLRFLLSDEPDLEPAGMDLNESGNGTWDFEAFDMPIFEQLMKITARNPKRIHTINEVIKRLLEPDEHGKQLDTVPDEFHSFWDVFTKLAEDLK